ncbi:hypothetical protein [Streptomyces sp. NPDC005407]
MLRSEGGVVAELVELYVAASFGQHLREIPQPLLAGPIAANPEVKFNNP